MLNKFIYYVNNFSTYNVRKRNEILKTQFFPVSIKYIVIVIFRSMKQNLVVFLADMYNVLEIHPAKCVRYPGEERAMQYLDGT